MKKLVVATLIFMFPLVVSIFNLEPTSASCEEALTLEDVNSYNLKNYIEENNLKVTYICANNFCQKLKYDLEADIKTFREDYLAYIKDNVDEETYQAVELKGFKITTIRVNNCQ